LSFFRISKFSLFQAIVSFITITWTNITTLAKCFSKVLTIINLCAKNHSAAIIAVPVSTSYQAIVSFLTKTWTNINSFDISFVLKQEEF